MLDISKMKRLADLREIIAKLESNLSQTEKALAISKVNRLRDAALNEFCSFFSSRGFAVPKRTVEVHIIAKYKDTEISIKYLRENNSLIIIAGSKKAGTIIIAPIKENHIKPSSSTITFDEESEIARLEQKIEELNKAIESVNGIQYCYMIEDHENMIEYNEFSDVLNALFA